MGNPLEKLTKFALLSAAFAFAFATLFFLFAVFSEAAARALVQAYAHIADDPATKFSTFLSFLGVLIAFGGVVAALLTFLLNSRATRNAQRKQHTITILLETRLSEYFQTIIARRRVKFPEFTDILTAHWQACLNAPADQATGEARKVAQQERDAAQAVLQLLNYYEFLAVGIKEGDLDEPMLRKTIRGIMCNLVDDARFIIAELRSDNPKVYEHLVELYEKWRIPGAKDINGNDNERPIPTTPR